MSETQRTKDVVNDELLRVFNIGKAIAKKIDDLPGDENIDKRQPLLEDLRNAAKLEETLNNEFARLVESEKKPELERIQALSKELRAPMVGPSVNYFAMYGRGGIGGTPQVYDTQQPSVEQQITRKRELIGERFNLPPSKVVD